MALAAPASLLTASLFAVAGLLHIVENEITLLDTDDGFSACGVSLADMVYLTITTITTVGYGDISPRTDIGKSIIMVLMCTALVLVPKQTNKLIEIMNLRTQYQRTRYTVAKGPRERRCGPGGGVGRGRSKRAFPSGG